MTAPLQKMPNLFRKVGSAGKTAGSQGKSGMQNLTSSIFKANAALDILKAGFQKIVQSIGQVINATDTWTNTTARLDLINDGSQTTAQLREKVLGAATRSRGDYNTMASTTAKLGMLAGENFKNNDEVIKFSELMQKSFVVSGASQSEQDAGMYQLTQAMAAGKLQGDEFRSIMENAPMLADAIAKYTGKSKGELKEMSSEGLITADIIKAALFKAGDDINKKFDTMPRTFASVWTDIKNNALFAFKDIMEGMNKFLNSDVGIEIVDKIKTAFTKLSKTVTNIFNWISEHALLVKSALAGIATVISTKLIGSFVKLGISLLTNPMTWIAVAIFAIGAGLYYAYQKCEPFRVAVQNIGNVIKAAFGDQNAMAGLMEKFPQLAKVAIVLREAVLKVKAGFQQLWQIILGLVNWFKESGLIEFFMTIGQTLKDSILQTFTKIGEVYNTYIKPAIENLIAGFTKIKDTFVQAWQEHIKPVLDELGQKFQTIWVEHVQPFINGFIEGAGRIFEALSVLWNEILVPIWMWIWEKIVEKLMPVIQTIGDIVMTVIGTICDVLGGLWDVLVGLIDFIVGVFTGDWERAWEGISSIFSGIWNGLKGIAEGVINTIIGLINGCIRQVNKLSVDVPDWVPGFGGETFGFNIPEIGEVSFAQGTKGAYNTPETFIAGENGPELITGAKNRRVYPADETSDMLGQGGNVINITMNIDGSKDPQTTAGYVRQELENLFASFNRRNPRVREV